jgi:hypothetical protein
LNALFHQINLIFWFPTVLLGGLIENMHMIFTNIKFLYVQPE